MYTSPVNNTKYYTQNLAHNFDMFLPKEARDREEKAEIIKLPTLNGKAGALRRQKEALYARLRAAAAATVVILLVLAFLFMRAQITEVSTQIETAKATLNQVKSEHTALEIQLEALVSYSNIEQEAANIGMQKKLRSQTVYIKTGSDSYAEVGNGTTVTADAGEE